MKAEKQWTNKKKKNKKTETWARSYFDYIACAFIIKNGFIRSSKVWLQSNQDQKPPLPQNEIEVQDTYWIVIRERRVLNQP